MADTEELDPIDVLAYITEELQTRFRNAKDDAAAQTAEMKEFLRSWEADAELDATKKLPVEFEKDLDWFNVTEPLSMSALRGRVVILDFFTYCCINCMHILPELHALEKQFPPERGLLIVGVHSPKFANEKESVNILSAAQRYGIEHPIVNDPQSTLWRTLGIRCWPTLLVLSPTGAPLLLMMGEGHGEFLNCFVAEALRYFSEKREIVTPLQSLPLHPSTDLVPASNLRFPAKIARGPDGRFAIADAGNNRILIVAATGIVEYKVGGNAAGFVDGDFTKTRFNAPQGVAFLDTDVLVVADTENHALRQITLSKQTVETLAGNGQQGTDRIGGKVGAEQLLSSPWDVAVYRTRDMDMSFHVDEEHIEPKTIVLIAMAGTHQIWGYCPPDGIIWWKFRKYEPRSCVALIGNGLEENRNNSYPQNAAFAQPSGLALAKDQLYIADSESSSIRKASMLDGTVSAVVGGDRNPLNLFAYGDVDGKQYNAKLQHPLGVAYNHVRETVYVADTYNSKIKVIDPLTNTVSTLRIKSQTGDDFQFNEPAGLCVDSSGRFLLVADTNNHSVQLVDLDTLTSQPFNLVFSQLAAATANETDSARRQRGGGLQLSKRLPLRQCKKLKLNIAMKLKDGLKFNAEAPQKWELSSTNSTLQATVNSGALSGGPLVLQLERKGSVASQKAQEQEELKLNFSLTLCDAKSCLMKRFSLLLSDAGEVTASGNVVLEENINIQISHGDIKLS